MYNNIPLTKETIDIYKAHLENGSYEDDTYATNENRMVTLVSTNRNCPYRYHLRATDGRYLSMVKTTDEAINFLMTGEYIDCCNGTAQRW